MLVAYHQS